MLPRAVVREGENAFERTLNILDMIYKFPDHMSDEEVEGAANYVNPDIRNTVLGLFEIESARDLEVLFIKRVIDILREAQRAQSEGKKVVFIPFTFPPEIIFSFESLFPVCTEVVTGIVVNVCAGQGERFWDFAMEFPNNTTVLPSSDWSSMLPSSVFMSAPIRYSRSSGFMPVNVSCVEGAPPPKTILPGIPPPPRVNPLVIL